VPPSMGELAFAVRGTAPAPWGGNEWAWRRALADEARAVRGSSAPSPPQDAVFTVEVVFYLGEQAFGRADLDNLAKPVLDTLFESRNPQAPDAALTGALFPGVDDDRVTRLHLEKRPAAAPELQGADIKVSCS
jgi:hypothetical protein